MIFVVELAVVSSVKILECTNIHDFIKCWVKKEKSSIDCSTVTVPVYTTQPCSPVQSGKNVYFEKHKKKTENKTKTADENTRGLYAAFLPSFLS